MSEIAVYGYGDNYDLIDWSLDFVPKRDSHGNIDAVDHSVVAAEVVHEVSGVKSGWDRDGNYVEGGR